MAIVDAYTFDDIASSSELTDHFGWQGITLTASHPRSGTQAVFSGFGNADQAICPFPTGTASEYVCISGSVYIDGSFQGEEPFLALKFSGTNHLMLYRLSDGRLEVRRGTASLAVPLISTSTLSLGVMYWYSIRCRIHDTLGEVEARINGSYTGWIPPATGIDTRNGSTAQVDSLGFGRGGGQAAYFDDLIIANTSGDQCLPENTVLLTRFPSGDGNYQDFTRSSGAGTRASHVDESPGQNGNTDYVHSTTLNHKDTYTKAALGVTGTPLFMKDVVWAAKSASGDTRGYKTLYRDGGVDALGSTEDFPSVQPSYEPLVERFTVHPVGGSVLTIANIDSMEWGQQMTTVA